MVMLFFFDLRRRGGKIGESKAESLLALRKESDVSSLPVSLGLYLFDST